MSRNLTSLILEYEEDGIEETSFKMVLCLEEDPYNEVKGQ